MTAKNSFKLSQPEEKFSFISNDMWILEVG